MLTYSGGGGQKGYVNPLPKLARDIHSGFMPFTLPRRLQIEWTRQIPQVPLENSFRQKQVPSVKFHSQRGQLEREHNFSPHFYASSTSTYPYMEANASRDGEPICDQYRSLISENFSIVALADGCNWGEAPSTAAYRATKMFIDYVDSKRSEIFNTQKLAFTCLGAIIESHNYIIRHNSADKRKIGTTTLLGGVLVRVQPTSVNQPLRSFPPFSNFPSYSSSSTVPSPTLASSGSGILSSSSSSSPVLLSSSSSSSSSSHHFSSNDLKFSLADMSVRKKSICLSFSSGGPSRDGHMPDLLNDESVTKPWAFVFSSIGDCKAFVWSRRLRCITEITSESRINSVTNASDCGGRIGPFLDGNPDLGNLNVYTAFLEDSDVLLLCTDGVYDNFDPQVLGFSPQQFGMNVNRWEEGDNQLVNRVKCEYRSMLINQIIGNSLGFHVTCDRLGTSVLMQCINTTQSSRRFMQMNPKRRLPSDYSRYPGKTDHTSLICLRVGSIPVVHIKTLEESLKLIRQKQQQQQRKILNSSTLRFVTSSPPPPPPLPLPLPPQLLVSPSPSPPYSTSPLVICSPKSDDTQESPPILPLCSPRVLLSNSQSGASSPPALPPLLLSVVQERDPSPASSPRDDHNQHLLSPPLRSRQPLLTINSHLHPSADESDTIMSTISSASNSSSSSGLCDSNSVPSSSLTLAIESKRTPSLSHEKSDEDISDSEAHIDSQIDDDDDDDNNNSSNGNQPSGSHHPVRGSKNLLPQPNLWKLDLEESLKSLSEEELLPLPNLPKPFSVHAIPEVPIAVGSRRQSFSGLKMVRVYLSDDTYRSVRITPMSRVSDICDMMISKMRSTVASSDWESYRFYIQMANEPQAREVPMDQLLGDVAVENRFIFCRMDDIVLLQNLFNGSSISFETPDIVPQLPSSENDEIDIEKKKRKRHSSGSFSRHSRVNFTNT